MQRLRDLPAYLHPVYGLAGILAGVKNSELPLCGQRPGGSTFQTRGAATVTASLKETVSKLNPKRLGELLVECGLLDVKELNEALDVQRRHGGRLGEILVKQGLIKYDDLLAILSTQFHVPIAEVRGRLIPRQVLDLVPEAIAREHTLIPVEASETSLLIVMGYPEDVSTVDAISTIAKKRVDIAIGAPLDIEQAINLNYKSNSLLDKQISRIETLEESKIEPQVDGISDTAPVAKTLNMIIDQAVQDRASDIHLEPQENRLRVRFRIDGILHDVYSLPVSVHSQLSARLKIMSKMNITEHRRPQDGQFSVRYGTRNVDIRAAAVGTSHGERVTLRILDKSLTLLTLDQLGFQPGTLKQFRAMLKSAFGLILVGGPTGSGKTTSLYAAINHLDRRELNIMTIEDPIEYSFTDISQMQVNDKAGITFATGLKAMLRHDPDVILVGEIRDRDTAVIAIQAALTGHLVLASIHANDSVSMLCRLVQLGVEPHLITSTVIGLLAQRMVRRLCQQCHRPLQPSADQQHAYFAEIGEEAPLTYEAKGCTFCANTGYLGRIGIFELLTMSDAIRNRLLNGGDAPALREEALKQGMVTMAHDGMMKVRDGTTSIMEVLRCIQTVGY